MANRKGLGVSKKYANGTIHETATGQFVVLDRFADEDDEQAIPMLEFKWISGEKEGKTETNREMNMAANIHKFQTSRGRPTIQSEPRTIADDINFVEKIDMTYDIVTGLKEHLANDELKIERINRTLDEVNGIKSYIDKAAQSVMDNNNRFSAKIDDVHDMIVSNREYIANTYNMITKLENLVLSQQESIIQMTAQIHSLIQHNTTISKQQESMAMQQAVVNKLIEKL